MDWEIPLVSKKNLLTCWTRESPYTCFQRGTSDEYFSLTGGNPIRVLCLPHYVFTSVTMERPFCGGLGQDESCMLIHLTRVLNHREEPEQYLLEGDCFTVQRCGGAGLRRGLVSVLMPETILRCYVDTDALKINEAAMDQIFVSPMRLNSYSGLKAPMAALTCGLLSPMHFHNQVLKGASTGGIYEIHMPVDVYNLEGEVRNTVGPGAFNVVIGEDRSENGGIRVIEARGHKKPHGTCLDEYYNYSVSSARSFYNILKKDPYLEGWQTLTPKLYREVNTLFM